jgi:thioredoxin 1
MSSKNSKIFYRVGVVVILIVVVAIVVALKFRGTDKKKTEKVVTKAEETVDTLAELSRSKESIISESLSVLTKPTETLALKDVGKKVDDVQRVQPMGKDVIAVVDGEAITKRQFDSTFNSLPTQIKEIFKDDKAGFLEELITRQLLLQDAKRKKVNEQNEYKDAVTKSPDQKENITINLLFKIILADVTVSESELREFFNQYQDQLPNKNYESAKEQLRPMALEEKQRLVVEEYLNNLKSSAKIERNEQWIKTQEALTADNPLSKALKTGRPVLADFGRGTCVPCKMMQPILEKLQEDYVGKAEILILDVGEYASLAQKYRIRMIPTQIFLDAKGKEVYRHQGFMPEADIVAQLKKIGVNDVR